MTVRDVLAREAGAMSADDLSYRLFVTGENCAIAGLLIHRHMRASGDGALVTSLWIELGFATEILLKCHLATAGLNEKEIRSYGHDLEKAFDRALQTGLMLEKMQDLADLVRLLNPSHKGCHFRYMPAGPLQGVAEVDRVLEVLKELAQTLWSKVTIPDDQAAQ
jgi:hypothetical protein